MTFEHAIAAVALVSQPLALTTPVDVLFRLPHIRTPPAETESLEPHRLQCDISRKNHEVSPRDLPAIFLLDRPQEPPCLVEVRIVRPAIERSKALRPRACSTAAVADAIRPRAVPRHANEERTIVTVIRRPPLLRRCHQGMKILDHRIQIERLEFFRIIELLAHGISQRRILVKDFQTKLIRPPVRVGRSTATAMRDGALALG